MKKSRLGKTYSIFKKMDIPPAAAALVAGLIGSRLNLTHYSREENFVAAIKERLKG